MSETKKKVVGMGGIQYVTDEKGKKVAVRINRKKLGEVWEDFYDNLLAERRAEEPRESLESVRKRLEGQG
jgi:hypothetical protein